MTDISVKIRAEQLGKDLDNLSISLENELNQAVLDLANTAYAHIVANAQKNLKSTRQDYLRNLSFTDLGNNSYLISLEGTGPNAVEEGYGSFDMKPGLLGSKKISANGEPWVKTNKDGKKYAHVPFSHHPTAKGSDPLIKSIQQLTAKNKQGSIQKLTKIFEDEFGKPISGKVAVAKSDISILNNMTKFQHVSEKGKVSSLYMTFRTVSENSDGWIHPGHEGMHFFQEAEKYIEDQLDLIIKTLL